MLYIMRHGQTDWNVRHKMQGRTDIPLNEEGRRMARTAAEEYRNVPFDVCYCSPLSRAQETARLVLAGRDVPIITDERLVEMGFGIYEGQSDLLEQEDCPLNVLFREPARYQPVEGGESLEELFGRTGDFLERVVRPQLTAGRDILIVGHGAMNACIVCQVKGLPVERFWDYNLDQCRLMELLPDEPPYISATRS